MILGEEASSLCVIYEVVHAQMTRAQATKMQPDFKLSKTNPRGTPCSWCSGGNKKEQTQRRHFWSDGKDRDGFDCGFSGCGRCGDIERGCDKGSARGFTDDVEGEDWKQWKDRSKRMKRWTKRRRRGASCLSRRKKKLLQ